MLILHKIRARFGRVFWYAGLLTTAEKCDTMVVQGGTGSRPFLRAKNNNFGDVKMNLDMTFIKIYSFMTKQLQLVGYERDIFALIYSFHESGTRCTATTGYLAMRACCSESTVKRTLANLEGYGLITVRKNGKSSEITVNEPAIHRLASEVAASGGGFPDGF